MLFYKKEVFHFFWYILSYHKFIIKINFSKTIVIKKAKKKTMRQSKFNKLHLRDNSTNSIKL